MPTEYARMPADTFTAALTRGAAYCPALANEVREFPRVRSYWILISRFIWCCIGFAAIIVCIGAWRG